MPVRAAALGLELAPQTVEVTARMTLAYAAGVGDVGPRTFDDAGALPIVAPPAFCARLEWGVLLAGRGSSFGLDERERARAVHVEQDSTFHRPIRPGDVLTTRGRVATIRQTSAGALVRTRLATTEAATGAPVVTSWHASIYRGVGVEGEGGSVAAPPEVPPALTTLGSSRSIPISREAAHVYTECASIWNPIHSERRFALAQGLPDVILHGTATWAMAGREIVAFYAGGDPTRLKRLRAKFKSPVIPGYPITLMHGAADPGAAHFRVTNHLGEPALLEGFALLQA
jgi:acyl dehydratase